MLQVSDLISMTKSTRSVRVCAVSCVLWTSLALPQEIAGRREVIDVCRLDSLPTGIDRQISVRGPLVDQGMGPYLSAQHCPMLIGKRTNGLEWRLQNYVSMYPLTQRARDGGWTSGSRDEDVEVCGDARHPERR